MKIVYVGKNTDGKEDNLYGSGVIWTKPGDVQEVSDPEIVLKMLQHDDTWALAKGETFSSEKSAAKESDDAVRAKKERERQEKEFLEEQEQRDIEVTSLARMNKETLIAHAKRNYGIDVSPKDKIEVVRNRVRAIVERSSAVRTTQPTRSTPAKKKR